MSSKQLPMLEVGGDKVYQGDYRKSKWYFMALALHMDVFARLVPLGLPGIHHGMPENYYVGLLRLRSQEQIAQLIAVSCDSSVKDSSFKKLCDDDAELIPMCDKDTSGCDGGINVGVLVRRAYSCISLGTVNSEMWVQALRQELVPVWLGRGRTSRLCCVSLRGQCSRSRGCPGDPDLGPHRRLFLGGQRHVVEDRDGGLQCDPRRDVECLPDRVGGGYCSGGPRPQPRAQRVHYAGRFRFDRDASAPHLHAGPLRQLQPCQWEAEGVDSMPIAQAPGMFPIHVGGEGQQ